MFRYVVPGMHASFVRSFVRSLNYGCSMLCARRTCTKGQTDVNQGTKDEGGGGGGIDCQNIKKNCTEKDSDT